MGSTARVPFLKAAFSFPTVSLCVAVTAGHQVVQYVAFEDSQDSAGGHGTHVVGSAVGSVGDG